MTLTSMKISSNVPILFLKKYMKNSQSFGEKKNKKSQSSLAAILVGGPAIWTDESFLHKTI